MKESELKGKKLWEKLPNLEKLHMITRSEYSYLSPRKSKGCIIRTKNAFKIGSEKSYHVICDIHFFFPEEIVTYERNAKQGFKKDIANVIEKDKEIGISKEIILFHKNHDLYCVTANGYTGLRIRNDINKKHNLHFHQEFGNRLVYSLYNDYLKIINQRKK